MFVFIQVVSALVLALPSFVLVFYTRAAGESFGWWHDDPTNNDGPMVPILFSLAALAVCVLIASLTTRVASRAVWLARPIRSLAIACACVVFLVALGNWWYLAH